MSDESLLNEFPSEMEIDDGIGEDMSQPTTGKIPIRRVLEGAKKAQEEFDSILILGWLKDGTFYAAADGGRKADTLWLLEIAKKKLMENW